MAKKPLTLAFKNTDEYFHFAVEHQVFGHEAIKLKQRLDKLKASILTKIKPPR